MDEPRDDLTELGVAGALAANYARDGRNFLPLLAAVLSASLPDETKVERKGGIFQKSKPVFRVTVTGASHVYTIEDTGHGPLVATRVHVVRGIVLKREDIAMDIWLEHIATEIADRAKGSERAFFALKNLLD